jgi:hypothetical protein
MFLASTVISELDSIIIAIIHVCCCSRCQVKLSGDMMLSFPAGIVAVLANNPSPAQLSFRIRNTQRLDNIVPNKQLVTV